MQRYEEFEQVGDVHTLTMCTGCGAAVCDTDIHDNFHKYIENIARTAGSAHAGAYPQGYGRY